MRHLKLRSARKNLKNTHTRPEEDAHSKLTQQHVNRKGTHANVSVEASGSNVDEEKMGPKKNSWDDPISRSEDHSDLKSQGAQKMMALACHACGRPFNSTFTVSEFSNLSTAQYESGTLHLCPHCGEVSMYMLKDYFEK